MKLFKIAGLVFVVALCTGMNVSRGNPTALKSGEDAFQVRIRSFRSGKVVELELEKVVYQSYFADEEYRSSIPTDWKILLKDKKKKLLDSAFVVLERRTPGLPDGGFKTDPPGMSYEVFEAGHIIFKKHLSAYLVEVRFKGKLRASKKMDEARGKWSEAIPKEK